MKKVLLLSLAVPAVAFAQSTASTQPDLLSKLPLRELGPTTMGGRVSGIAVYDKTPRIFFVAAASGGIWKTENGGLTFDPIFQHEGSASIGGVAVCQSDPNLVWVGTGEGTERNSVSWGDGIYKSTDGGKTWQNMGLRNCQSFSKVLIDPNNPNTVLAAGLGQTWGYNQDRGVFKTTDGGKTWRKVLYIDEKTGIADMVMDPKNPHNLLAAAYQHLRYPYNYVSGGPGSGLYRSTDGGNSWHEVHQGLPTSNVGRIGLSYFYKDPRIVIATVEAKDATGLYRSSDGGDAWKKISILNPRPFYFSLPRQDPMLANRMYLGAVSMNVSNDMGKTFSVVETGVHVDHHAMWIDPNDNNHMLIGEDGGVAQTRDGGLHWDHLNSLRIGQFYIVTYDMREPYWVYGGLQDNGCWAGPTQTDRSGVSFFDFYGIGGGDGFHVQVDPNDWTTAYSESQGGDIERLDQKFGGGRSIVPKAGKGEKYRANWNTPFILSSFNSKTLYFGANRLYKSDDRGDHWQEISPDLTQNNPAWEKPGEGSVTPEDTGAETYDTIYTISESPMKQGLIWIGTDDGLVQLTQDDGAHWTNVTSHIPGLPANTWVSRICASRFAEGRAYATFDGHRDNDYATYVYVTEDYGKTWTMLNANLPPNESCNVIVEGVHNPNLLILGTEFNLYFSFDRGKSWTRYQSTDWPTVPVDDVTIQPRDEDLIIGTHGRSIWILPIGALDQLTPDNLAKDVFLAQPSPVYLFGRVSRGAWEGDRVWESANTQPGTSICYYLAKGGSETPKIKITDPAGTKTIAEMDGTDKAGLNVVTWAARGARVVGGDYRLTLTVHGKDYVTDVKVEEVTDEQNVSPPRVTPGVTSETELQADPDDPKAVGNSKRP